jgi:hypothetical protein
VQLVQVTKESGLPFDYVLVVDTEGLRAPELGQMKHDHDNELATLVIGLGDVTIMNIKGENASEMHDVLQIAVHAFLRMKLANRNVHLRQKCVFLHQDVSAINARDKLAYGCQKMQQNLDDMAKEAAALEEICDVSTFSDVIDFDGQKHIWFVTNLWHGDPPMAPVNPGYSKQTQNVKGCLLFDITKDWRSFVSISDVSIRLEDIWNGVLSDDFVFSFKNSLAAKAYNGLEAKYFELIWKLENHISTWVTTSATGKMSQSSLAQVENCAVNLLNELNTCTSVKLAEIKEELQQYFVESEYSDILVQWETERINSLRSVANDLIATATKEIRAMKEKHRIDFLQETKQAEHEREIMKKAKDLADEMKGKKVDDTTLLTKFNTMWAMWMSEYAAKETEEDVSIPVQITNQLWQRLSKDGHLLRGELQKHSLGLPIHNLTLGRIEDNHFSIRKTWFKDKWDKYVASSPNKELRPQVLNVANAILYKIKVYLDNLCKEDSGFRETESKEIIEMVVQAVDDHNRSSDKKYAFQLLPTFKVMLAVHACRYAVQVFQQKQEDYNRKHGILAKLNSYRQTAWNMFTNMVMQSTQEVIVADLLCDKVEERMKDVVKKTIPREVVNNIVIYFSHIKASLLYHMLGDLASKGTFTDYKLYLDDPKSYALKWITQFTEGNLFSATRKDFPRYTDLVELQVKAIVNSLEKSVIDLTAKVAGQSNKFRKVEWVSTFCESLKPMLLLKESDLYQVKQITIADFDNLQRLLLKRITNLETEIMAEFRRDNAANIRWEGVTPYKQALDRLWGCEALCPYCREPCQRSDSDHYSKSSVSHTCIQHRPAGVGGDRWDEAYRKDQLLVESCNYKVQWQTLRFNCRDCHFECRRSPYCSTTGTDWVYHNSVEYKKFLPEWDIHPSAKTDSSEYWMWFMNKYKHQLKDMYQAQLPNIPPTWLDITIEKAKESLRRYLPKQ